MILTNAIQLSQSDLSAITERLDNIIDILIVTLVVCGLILGGVLFRHFRK